MNCKIYNVLFLCTGNSARSILGEALINQQRKGRFRGHSAGSYPKDEVHPLAIEALQQHRLPTAGLRSMNWDEFDREDSPVLDFVFTVCDNAAAEICPVWPGHAVRRPDRQLKPELVRTWRPIRRRIIPIKNPYGISRA